MLPLSALKEMHVLMATPCYASSVTQPYSMSMFTLGSAAVSLGLKCSLTQVSNTSIITHGRNVIVKTFLDCPDYTHLFFIDSDIEFKAEDVIRQLLADRDLVGATYPKKGFFYDSEGKPYTRTSITLLTEDVDPDEDGFKEVAELPTGFMCIRRNVFETLKKKYPGCRYRYNHTADKDEIFWRFFDFTIETGTMRYMTEDFNFCKLWRETGGKVYQDVQCKLGHMGQYLFT